MYPRSWDDGVHRDTSHGASNANNYTVSMFAETTRPVAIPLRELGAKRSAWGKKGSKGFSQISPTRLARPEGFVFFIAARRPRHGVFFHEVAQGYV